MDKSQDPRSIAHSTSCPPEGGSYHYRRGGHELVLSARGMTDRLVEDVKLAKAEFALIVEGPWIVLGYHFGANGWSYAAPFNWHTQQCGAQSLPPDIKLSGETYARLWATLWIRLVDADSGTVRARRAVALRPEFTCALQGALREQAREPQLGAVADHALAWLHHSDDPPLARAVARSKSAAVARPEAIVTTARGRRTAGSPSSRSTRVRTIHYARPIIRGACRSASSPS